MRLSIFYLCVALLSVFLFRSASAQTTEELSHYRFVGLDNSLKEQVEEGGLGYFDRRITFRLDSTGGILFTNESRTLDSAVAASLVNLLGEDKASFKPGFQYTILSLRDHLTQRFYSAISEEQIPDSTVTMFINYDEIYPGKPKDLALLVQEDLHRNLDLTDVDSMDWDLPIDAYISDIDTYQFLNNHPLVPFLDRAKTVKWKPSLYHAQVMPTIMSFRVDKEEYLTNRTVKLHWYRPQFVLHEKFKEQHVRFLDVGPRHDLPPLRMKVSFVMRPGVGFVDPVMHMGEISEMREFIDWMTSFSFDTRAFYWSNLVQAKRFFFYIR